MRKLFFSSPIGRLLFLFRLLVLTAIGELAYYASGILIGIDMRLDREVIPFWLIIAFCIFAAIPAVIYTVVYSAMPRLQDIGISKWFALILLIPVKLVSGLCVLFLLCAPRSNRCIVEQKA